MEVSGPVGVKRMTIGLPNHVNAAPTSPDSNGRRMSRLVSIVARTGCYPCETDKSCSWLGFLSKIASLSEESIFVFEFVSFISRAQKKIVPTGGSDAPGSLHGSLMRPIQCAPNLRR